METYKEGAGLAIGSMMVKWNTLDTHVDMAPIKFEEGEPINVFINCESFLRNLTLQRGLTANIAYYKQNVVIELESAILNLVAHYRSYWKKEHTDPHVYLYYTDLKSDREQLMKIYNKYYRDSYFNKYLNNPAYRAMGDLMSSVVIPEVELILQYIPRCYLLRAPCYDSSIIPYAISAMNGYKSVIVTGDVFDSLYLFNPSFLTMYIKRRFNYFLLCSNVEAVVQSILKQMSPYDLTIFNSELYFRLLLATKGSKIRNIKGAFGMGVQTLVDILKNGMAQGIILRDFESIQSVAELFPLKYQDDMKRAFQCTSIEDQFALLGDSDMDELQSQIVDRVDPTSVMALNNKRFLSNPINLQGLLE